jgi:hypothetical protein
MPLGSLAGCLLILGVLAQSPEQPDRWSTIRSAEDDFSAMLPSQASTKTQDVSTPAGKVEQEMKAEDVGPDRALILPAGASLPTRVHKVEGHWKVDPSAVIASRKAAEAARRNAAQKNPGAAR